MGWKDWPYWLKGGIIGFLIPIFFGILFLLDIEWPAKILYFFDFVSLILCGGNVYINGCRNDLGALLATYHLTSVISTTVIGAIIGWIVGKIKQHKILESSENIR